MNTREIPRSGFEKELSLSQALQIYFITRPNDASLWKAYIRIFSPVLPFNYNSRKEEFTKATKFQTLCWIPMVLYTVFQVVRFALETRRLIISGDPEDTFILVFWICAHSSTLVHLYNGVRNIDTFLAVLRYWQDLKGGEITAFTFLLRSLIPIGTITTFWNSLLFLYLPKKQYFLFSIFNLEDHGLIYWFLWAPIFLLYEFMAGYIVFGIHVIQDAFLLGWITTIKANIEELSSSNDDEGKSLSDKEVRGYRSMQIFERIANQAMSSVFFYSKLSSYIQISYVIVMVVSGLATWNVLNICYGFPQCISLIMRMSGFLRTMASMRSVSIQILEKWMKEKVMNRKYTEGVVKSCRKLEYHAGDAYEIKKSTILSFGAGTMDQTVGLLITIKSANLF